MSINFIYSLPHVLGFAFLQNSEKVWNVRVHNGVVAVRNLCWPGSCSVGLASSSINSTPAGPGEVELKNTLQYTSIYVGYGIKAATKSFTPKMPAAIATECTEEMAEEEDVLTEPVKEEEDDE